MRCSDRLRGQRGFTLMEVMTAALILSALVVSIGSGWVVADRETSNLITRQKAIFVADAEMERLLEAAARAGAVRAGYVLLRLPLEIAGLFAEWLETHYPDRAKRVMALLRSMHRGQDYRSEWKTRQRGDGPYARLIADRFRRATERLGLNRVSFDLRTDLFHPPKTERKEGQMSLF